MKVCYPLNYKECAVIKKPVELYKVLWDSLHIHLMSATEGQLFPEAKHLF